MPNFEDDDTQDVFDKAAKSDEDDVEEKGDKEVEEVPPAASEEPPVEDKSDNEEKMVPESRLKAAVRGISEELDAARAKLSQYESSPVPDKSQDPDGYERHVRIETSKEIMRSTFPDYEEKIKHFIEMAKDNENLNQIVANHALPAKFAYDLAKEDMSIRELRSHKSSDEYKEFLKWKASQGVAEKLSDKALVPNLNRKATSVGPSNKKSDSDDDGLFDGHYSVG